MSSTGTSNLSHDDGPLNLTEEEEKTVRKKVQHTALRLAVGAAFHPLNYVKVLMQLGHEPLPLRRGKSLWFIGHTVDYLPNGLIYARHIYRDTGFVSLYTGLGASIFGNITGAAAAIATTIAFDRKNPDWSEDLTTSNAKGTDEEAFKRMCKKAFRESVAKVAGTVAARPFQVVMIRQMAQYIGGEEHYVGVIASLRTIHREEGWGGFFKGLVPQIIAELITVWALHSAHLAIDRIWLRISKETYEEEEEEDEGLDLSQVDDAQAIKTVKKLLKLILPFAVSSFIYPYQLVSTMMAVNGCSLTAGQSPYICQFGRWQDCWQYLQMTKQTKRGAKMLMRTYTGPITFSGGQKMANTKYKKV